MKKISRKQKLIAFIAILLVVIILAILITTKIVNNNGVGREGYAATANAGSTLVANYIKKGITIGGITGTLESLDTSDATATPEDIAWGKTAYVKGKKITGTYLTLGMLEIGDYVDYIPDSADSYYASSTNTGNMNQTIPQEDLNWRVLSINDNGTVDLISDVPTSTYFYLNRAFGYNNGVYLLNDIMAKLYSNSSLGVTARCINIEDVEAGMNERGLEYVHSYNNGYRSIGDTATYTQYRFYPLLYAQEIGSGIDTQIVKTTGAKPSDNYYSSPTTDFQTEASSFITVTQTYYEREMDSTYYKNSTFYELIHSGQYWLASRFVDTEETSTAKFGIRAVNNNSLKCGMWTDSSGNGSSYRVYLRPVVSINSNIKLSSGDGQSADTAYQIAQ